MPEMSNERLQEIAGAPEGFPNPEFRFMARELLRYREATACAWRVVCAACGPWGTFPTKQEALNTVSLHVSAQSGTHDCRVEPLFTREAHNEPHD